MYRNLAAALICTGVLLAGAPARAADVPDLVGTWQVDHDGYNETWTIAQDKDKGDWSVGGIFRKKDQEVGAWKGEKVQYADGKLTCIQRWARKPDPTWGDETKLTASATGDKLTFTWDNGGGNSGTRDMMRIKAGGDGSDLVGLWQVEHDGYYEVWNIQMKKGQFAVEGAFYQQGRKVGYFVGLAPRFADGKLVCTQKWVVKPIRTWTDGNTLTAQVAGDKLTFTWNTGTGQSGSRDLIKVR